jgi:hypothetical protein
MGGATVMRIRLHAALGLGLLGCSSAGSAAQPSNDSGRDAAPEQTHAEAGSDAGGGAGDARVPEASAGPEGGGLDASKDASSDALGPAAEASTPCPTKAPADTEDPSIRDRCTQMVYIAGGDNNTLIVSYDGTSWNSFAVHDIPGDDYINFISVAQGVVTTTSLPGVYQSTDGAKNFTLVGSISHNGFDTYGGQLDFGDKGLLLTDNEGTYLAADGVTWMRQSPFPGQSDKDGFGGHFHGTAFGNGAYVAFQDNGTFRQFDGTSFFDGTASGMVDSVAFGGGVFVGVGGGSVLTSPDGKQWTSQSSISNASPESILFDGAAFLAYDNGTVARSTDGKHWTTSPLANGARVYTAAYYAGQYFAAGNSGGTEALLLSSDGMNWSVAHATTSTETFNINGPRVALGRVLK